MERLIRGYLLRDGAGSLAVGIVPVRDALEGCMLKKVAFTMFPVKDTPRARAFYEGTLVLRVGSHSDNGVWTEYDLPGGGCLAQATPSSCTSSGRVREAVAQREV